MGSLGGFFFLTANPVGQPLLWLAGTFPEREAMSPKELCWVDPHARQPCPGTAQRSLQL